MKDIFKINLQLFAEMNTNVTGDSGLSVENKTYYDMTLIDEAQANLIHDQFAQKRPIPKNGGKKIEFRKFASLPKALTPLTEGVTPDGKKLSVTSIEAEVAQYGDYIVQSDVLELTSIDNTIVEATKILGRQAGLTLDTITRNIMQSGTNVYYCPKADGTAVTSREALDATCKLTVDVVNRVVALLKKNNAPKINGDYVAIIHPLVAYDLMSDERWIDAHKYAQPDAIYNGELGKIGGIVGKYLLVAGNGHNADIILKAKLIAKSAESGKIALKICLIKANVTKTAGVVVNGNEDVYLCSANSLSTNMLLNTLFKENVCAGQLYVAIKET